MISYLIESNIFTDLYIEHYKKFLNAENKANKEQSKNYYSSSLEVIKKDFGKPSLNHQFALGVYFEHLLIFIFKLGYFCTTSLKILTRVNALFNNF